MTAEPVDAVVKQCKCGRAYDAQKWAALPLCGHMESLELRHCHCKSTIAIAKESK